MSCSITITLCLPASPTSNSPLRRPALADAHPTGPLDRLVGTWKATGTATMGPDHVRVAATWTCKAVSAGAGVGCTLRLTGLPGMVYQETDLFGVDPGTATMHWFSVTNAGEVHDHAATGSDGLTWRFLVEGVQRSRSGAADRSVTFTGRSIAMAAGEPYALPRNWVNEGAVTAAQLCMFSQETTGTIVIWGITDWLIPDKVWTFAGSPLAVVQRVAEAVGANVIADRTLNTLYVLPRYAMLPPEWAAATPHVTIAEQAVRSDSFERADRPAYNGVYVSGQQQGVIGVVFLAGTTGAAQAPLVTDLLITDAPAVRQRGRAILGAGGRGARVSMSLPVLTGAGQPGVLSPGQLCRVDAAVPWFGLVRSVSVNVDLPSVVQTVVLERHFS